MMDGGNFCCFVGGFFATKVMRISGFRSVDMEVQLFFWLPAASKRKPQGGTEKGDTELDTAIIPELAISPT